MRTGNEEGQMHRNYRKCPKCRHEIGPGVDFEERTCPNCGSEVSFNTYRTFRYKVGYIAFLFFTFIFFTVSVFIGLQTFFSVAAVFMMIGLLALITSYLQYRDYKREILIQRWNLKEKVE
jgi:predicted RNA-binding Zn-ribbon protein involved in translation (DUF1610 family)